MFLFRCFAGDFVVNMCFERVSVQTWFITNWENGIWLFYLWFSRQQWGVSWMIDMPDMESNERPLQDWISAKDKFQKKSRSKGVFVFVLILFASQFLNSPENTKKNMSLLFDLLYVFVSEFEESMDSETWGSICWTMISYPMCRMSSSRWWLRWGCTVDGGFSGY